MIYLDNAATTKICNESLIAINKYYCEEYFNPSAVYSGAINVRREIEKAREVIAKSLFVDKKSIFFTSGGTEGDNLAILGTCKNIGIGTIICSACEHPAVYNAVMELKSRGFDVEIIPCKHNGTIDIEEYKRIISSKKIGFASIMHINNETGGINDIKKLAKLLKTSNPSAIFHSDAVQAYGKKKINLIDSDIDIYSFSAHKINGAKGVGGIYLKNLNKTHPLQFGGGQEKGLRSGTENTGGIIAFKEAVNLWNNNRRTFLKNFSNFQKIIIEKLSHLEGITYNTDFEISSPHVLSLNISNIKGEVLLHMLEAENIFIGRGSACSTKDSSPRALKALNVSGEGTIRISFGIYNTKEEIEIFSNELVKNIYKLRKVMRS